MKDSTTIAANGQRRGHSFESVRLMASATMTAATRGRPQTVQQSAQQPTTPQTTHKDGRQTGTVTALKSTYGFLRPGGTSRDGSGGAGTGTVFFHMNQIQFEDVRVGDVVEYDGHTDHQGRVVATALTRLSPAGSNNFSRPAQYHHQHGGGGGGGRAEDTVIFLTQKRNSEAFVEVPAAPPSMPWGSLRVIKLNGEPIQEELLLSYNDSEATTTIDHLDSQGLKDDDLVQFTLAEDHQGLFAEDVALVARASMPRYQGVVESVKGKTAHICPTTTATDGGFVKIFNLHTDYTPSVQRPKDSRRHTCDVGTNVTFSIDPSNPDLAIFVHEVVPSAHDINNSETQVDPRILELQAKGSLSCVVVRDCSLSFMPATKGPPLDGLLRIPLDQSTDLIAHFSEADIKDIGNENLVGSLLNVTDHVQCNLTISSAFVVKATKLKHVRFGPHAAAVGRIEIIKRRNGFVNIPGQPYHVFFPVGNDFKLTEGDDVECTLITSNLQGRPTAFNLKRLAPQELSEEEVVEYRARGRVVCLPSPEGPGQITLMTNNTTIDFESRDIVDRNLSLRVNDVVLLDVARRNQGLAGVRIARHRVDPNFEYSATREYGMIAHLQDNFGFIAQAKAPNLEMVFFHVSEFVSPKTKMALHQEVGYILSVNKTDKRMSAMDVMALEPGTVQFLRLHGSIDLDGDRLTTRIVEESSQQVYRSYESDIAQDMCGLRTGDSVSFIGAIDSKLPGGKRAVSVRVEKQAEDERVMGVVVEIDEKISQIWCPALQELFFVPFVHWIDYSALRPPPSRGMLVDFVKVDKVVKKYNGTSNVHLATRVRAAVGSPSTFPQQLGEIKTMPSGSRSGIITIGDDSHSVSVSFQLDNLVPAEGLNVNDHIEFSLAIVDGALVAQQIKRLKRKTGFGRREQPKALPDVLVLRGPRGPDGTKGGGVDFLAGTVFQII